MDAPPPQPSLPARAGAWARDTATSTLASARAAPATSAVLVVLAAAHIARLVAGRPPLSTLCLATPAILGSPLRQAYRLASSALTHAGWVHLLFNLAALGPLLARREAVAPGAVLELAALVLAGGALFVGAGAVAAIAPPAAHLPTPGCAVGISGAIFGLMTASPASAPIPLAGGALTLPGRAYPWALIVALQFLIPGLSAAGHVCGALAGEGLGAARRAGCVGDPWGVGSGGWGLPTTVGGRGGGSAPSLLARLRAFFRREGGGQAGEWSPLPGEAPPGAGPSAADARAAAGAAAAARAAAAAAAAGR